MQFKTLTKWIAITGAPSSGKTSVLNVLAAKGYRICHEAARELIEERMKTGMTLSEVRSDKGSLQHDILKIKVDWSRSFDPDEIVFFDRGIPDSISYFRASGLDPDEVMPFALEFRYAHVFLFERLPVVHDGIRTESEADVSEMEKTLIADYVHLGYAPIRVPVMPVAARAEFLLKYLSN